MSHAAPIIGLVRSILQDLSITIRPGCRSLTKFVREEGVSWMAESLDAPGHLSQAEKGKQWGLEPEYSRVSILTENF